MIKEIWKDIKGYEGLYQISNYGNLKSLPKLIFINRYTKIKILSDRIDGNGYKHVLLYKNKKSKSFKIHKLVTDHFIENKNNKKEINHKDGNKLNNYFQNLEWCTHSENIKHSFRIGTSDNKGENHPRNKLTDKIVINIKKLYKTGKYSHKKIALIYNVHRSTISYVLNKKIWGHVW